MKVLPVSTYAPAASASETVATAITLRAKTGVDHWDITVRGGTVRVDVTDETVALTGSATLVADVTLI